MRARPDSSGGPVAIRGYLVQTLVALLDIAEADPPFTEITLEPAHADDQFDFVWSDTHGTFAVQVKSTINEFNKAAVEGWAQQLQAARKAEKCRLVLVGNYHTSLAKVGNVGAVVIEKRNLDLPGLFHQAAHQVAKFIHSQGLDARTPDENEMMAESLVTRLLRYSTTRESFTHDAFVTLLRGWVKDAPRQKRVIDISRIIRYAPARLIGREVETGLLSAAWDLTMRDEAKRPHILTFVAFGGEGKTSLVAKWAADLAHQDWPGCEAVYAWSFYSQGTREQTAASSDLFLKEALTFFGDPAMAGSAQSSFDKGRRLAQLIGERRALLILDGLEPLQYAPTSPMPGELRDQGLAALLKGLAAANHGLCVVTTRYSMPDLRAYWETTAPETNLPRLSKEAGVALLRSLGVKGTLQEFETLVEDVKGHALTINLLGTYLHDAHAGDIRKRGLVKLEEADAEEQGGHAFRVMDAYVRWFESDVVKGKRALAVMRMLGLFDRPVTADCLAALQKAPAIPGLTEALVRINETQRNVVLTRLESARLLTVRRDMAGTLVSLDAHPLLREYFARQLRTQYPDAWRGANRRLYEHLCATTLDKPQPTLEDLQPLYQAVAHGCKAGMQDACRKVFRRRIQRGREDYSIVKLGAFGSDLGAASCFFEQTWNRVSPGLTEPAQAWLLNLAAYCLRSLGRLCEALEPMRTGLMMAVEQNDWNNATRGACNVCELDLTLGNVPRALGEADKFVTYADHSGDAFMRIAILTTYADTLHQAGQRSKAREWFCEAEALQVARQPDAPLLYSLQGFQYCDLLLAAPERTAWRGILEIIEDATSSAGQGARTSHIQTCRVVSQRAAETLSLVMASHNSSLLDIALNHLTLGSAALYGAIFDGSSLEPCHSSLQRAVDGLRLAGAQDHLPRGLLTRAWLRSLAGARTGPASAQWDLDEAWEIAERGPMRLFMADIHLYRARLFFRETNYPWNMNIVGISRGPQDDLAAAEKLIHDCGYHRRDEELADAKLAILGQRK